MKYVTRTEWHHRGPLGVPLKRENIRGVWLHHTVTKPTDDPAYDARGINNIGIARFGMLSYSWLVHPDGTVLEGQGDTRGAHTAKQNSTSLGVACIGNYEKDEPTAAMLKAVADLLRHLDLPLLGGHRDVKATACPGRHLYARIPDLQRAARTPVVQRSATPDVRDGWRRHLERIKARRAR